MRPLYVPNRDHTLGYDGNKIFKPIPVIERSGALKALERRVEDVHENEMWFHISMINHTINKTANEYFDSIGSVFALLPLTTRMISSPGALYGNRRVDYTQDTIPVKLNWFNQGEVFLAESSQIYLELYLTIRNIKSVYAIYNSFRKEPADATHLSEFHHMEYEGKVTQEENKKLLIGLVATISDVLLKNNYDDLAFFLKDEDLASLRAFANNNAVVEMPFSEVLKLLRRTTGEIKYERFTAENFGAWEEVKATAEVDGLLLITQFPLYEIAFYHAPLLDSNQREVGENADLIWPYYREIIGSGHRVRSLDELLQKAEAFNLPRDDYEPYLQSRRYDDYIESSGFGMGWERFLQGLLKLPYIELTVPFPRVDTTIRP